MPRSSCFFCDNPARNHFCERCVSALAESPGVMESVNAALVPMVIVPLYSEQCACGRRKSTRREQCRRCFFDTLYHPCKGLPDSPCKNRCYKHRDHCWQCTKDMKRKNPPPGKWIVPAAATGAAADCARRLLMEINNRQRV